MARSMSSQTAAFAARAIMCGSQPISSPLSSKIQVAPRASSLSNARPTAGLPANTARAVGTAAYRADDQVADRQRTPRHGVGSARNPSTMHLPFSIVALVPPSCWITRVWHGRPEGSDIAFKTVAVKTLAASETSNTAPTLAWVHGLRTSR